MLFELLTFADMALPGDPLYSLKRSVERAEQLAATGQELRNWQYFIAETRLDELCALTERGQPVPVQAIRDASAALHMALQSDLLPAQERILRAYTSMVLKQLEYEDHISTADLAAIREQLAP